MPLIPRACGKRGSLRLTAPEEGAVAADPRRLAMTDILALIATASLAYVYTMRPQRR